MPHPANAEGDEKNQENHIPAAPVFGGPVEVGVHFGGHNSLAIYLPREELLENILGE